MQEPGLQWLEKVERHLKANLGLPEDTDPEEDLGIGFAWAHVALLWNKYTTNN